MKFRRKSAEPGSSGSAETRAESSPDDGPGVAPAGAAGQQGEGPFDVDDLPEDGLERVDLGSLLIAPLEGRELRVQVDEKSGAVQSVLLVAGDGALDLRAFAAPRGGDLWEEVRPKIAAEMAQRGGTATEQQGSFGTELACQLNVKLDDGRVGTQPSRVVGVNGPRWMLRATLLGRPAVDPEVGAAWERTLRSVAVRRGTHAMPVGEPLPVVLPDSARRVE